MRKPADESGLRVTLTTQNREFLADSAAHASPPPPRLPAQASAVVGPLSISTSSVDGTVSVGTAGSAADRVDPRAVGLFRLPASERTALRRTSDRLVKCLNAYGIASDVVQAPSGRPRVQVVGNDPARTQDTRCNTAVLEEPTATVSPDPHSVRSFSSDGSSPGGTVGWMTYQARNGTVEIAKISDPDGSMSAIITANGIPDAKHKPTKKKFTLPTEIADS